MHKKFAIVEGDGWLLFSMPPPQKKHKFTRHASKTLGAMTNYVSDMATYCLGLVQPCLIVTTSCSETTECHLPPVIPTCMLCVGHTALSELKLWK
jgi:hypothetical protein